MTEEMSAREIMEEFADRTGLSSQDAAAARRYLWTDAFAVCNYLGLYEMSGSEEHLHLALALVDQVHEILGRYRDDDSRSGWISGLTDPEGRLHPTAGGLRIGKKLPERQEGEPLDAGLEWECDGQYYHYLTKWMHALCSVGRAIDNPLYSSWAAELAGRAHKAFCYNAPDNEKRMYWKMSVDLTRPQVATMGHHDPLDGLLTCLEIQQQISGQTQKNSLDLAHAINDLAEMCREVNWTTPDPLGLGGLLSDAWRLVKLQSANGEIPLPGLLDDMLDAAVVGLSICTRENSMHLPAANRLAFRELGLSVGLQAIVRIESLQAMRPDLFRKASRLTSLLEALHQYLPLREQIEQFWLASGNREVPSWTDHGDINMVMLATSLAPDGFLDV